MLYIDVLFVFIKDISFNTSTRNLKKSFGKFKNLNYYLANCVNRREIMIQAAKH